MAFAVGLRRGASQRAAEPGAFQCSKCRLQTSPIAGTIFASTKLPLTVWFRAMYHMTQSKQGISSIELGRRLGVTQTTAWKIKHKLAQVMLERDATKKLTGRVEIDDAISVASAAAENADVVRQARHPSWLLRRQRRTVSQPALNCGASAASAQSR